MKIHNLPKDPGRQQKPTRVGRGEGSGLGRTSGYGNKGSQARSGRGKGYAGVFEGGQMPLVRRLPKRGFTSPFKVEFEVVNLSTLDKKFNAGETVNAESLRARKVVRTKAPVKVLGNGSITKSLNIDVHAVSASAKAKIEQAGGTVKVAEKAAK